MVRVDRTFAGIATGMTTGLGMSLIFGLVPWLLAAILTFPFIVLFSVLAKVTTRFYGVDEL